MEVLDMFQDTSKLYKHPLRQKKAEMENLKIYVEYEPLKPT